MKHISLALVLTILSCGGNDQEKIKKDLVDVYSYNVVIAPDLSNRINSNIHPKPIADTVIISDIYESIPEFIEIGNRQSQQCDIFTFDFINPGALIELQLNPEDLKIDFAQFKHRQLERSDYLRKGLSADILKAKAKCRAVYEYALNHSAGADIYNYLNSTVNNVLVPEADNIIEVNENLDARTSTKNVIILFTDGYIENVTKGNGYQLTHSTVTKIRESFKSSETKDLDQFIATHPEFQINPLTNKALRNARVLVVEIVDRSLNANGVATDHPTDFVIMRAVWGHWFKQSGIGDFDFVPAQNTAAQVRTNIIKFISRQSPSTRR